MSRQAQSSLEEWTAGFFDGEGWITNSISVRDDYDVGATINPKCGIAHTYHAGFFEAEGTIRVHTTVNEGSEIGYAQSADCQIMHTKSDSPLLKHLKEYLESIGVDYHVSWYDSDVENHAERFTVAVSNLEGVERYLDCLYPHLVLKQPQARVMLEDIIPLMKRGEHTNRRGFLKVMEHVDRMNEMKGGERGKYNLEYFEDLWGMEL